MKTKVFISILGTAVFLAALAYGPSLNAQVSTRGRPEERASQEYTNKGYAAGYHKGHSLGQRDAEAGQRYNFARHKAYTQRDEGYDRSLGALADYQESYRIGFEEGYQDGYDRIEKRIDRAGPSSIRYRPAFARGYQEGYGHGRRDAQSKRHYNFAHDPIYQRADLGYEAEQFPSPQDYQFNFRQGYEAGYDDGYNNRPYLDRRDISRTYTYRNPEEIRSSTHTYRRDREYPRSSTSGPLIVPEGTTAHLKLNNTISTRSAQSGDRFTAQVVEPVYVRDMVAIPSGSTVQGTVTRAIRPGRVEGRAELHLRFDNLTLPNDRTYALNASMVDLGSQSKGKVGEEGTATGPSSKKRDIGEIAIGSGVGAIIGAIAGGGKGAAIGAGVGAGAGAAVVLATRGRDLDLSQGTDITIKLNRPLELQP